MMTTLKTFEIMVVVFLTFMALVPRSQGLIHQLHIRHDDRNIFKIETFGFVSGGVMNITVSNFAVLFTLKEKAEQEQERARQNALNTPETSSPTSQPVSLAKGEGDLTEKESIEDVAVAKDVSIETEKEKVKIGDKVSEKVIEKEKEKEQDAETVQETDTESAKEKSSTKGKEKEKEKIKEKEDEAEAEQEKASAADSDKGSSSSASSSTSTSKTAGKEPIHSKPSKDSSSSNSKTGRPSEHSGHVSPGGSKADDGERMLTEAAAYPYKTGFILRRAPSESSAQQDLEQIIERGNCIYDHKNANDVLIDLSSPTSWKRTSFIHYIDDDSVGMYSLIFFRCSPSGPHLVNFELKAQFYNPGPNFLSAGDTQLPSLYFIFFILFTVALVVWCWALTRDPATGGVVHRIHYMMLILLSLKCLTLLFESIRYHYISLFGVSELWSIVYYFFAFLKGVMLFTVILLIGSGWSLMKSYLNDKEKKTILFVLMLQVLDNIAMIVIEETAPGSQGWLTWRDLLHLVDIICCCAILMPIVWSIRHLRQAAEVDGKAQNSLMKLQLFRQFYVMVVIYIYFTRIVVYLLTSTIPFYLLWMGPLAEETAALMFYVITGYKFRPAVDNPYIPVRTETLEAQEYGLEDGELDENGVEMYYK